MAANGFEAPASEFWPDAIFAVKSKYPDFVLLAEVTHAQQQFCLRLFP